MRPGTVAMLGLAALISAAAAVLSWSPGDTEISPEGAGQPVFPGMVDRANEIARIEVTEAGKTLTIHKGKAVWEIAGNGYPVERGKFQENMVGLLRLTKLERRTAAPAKYPLLQLGAPGEADGKGRDFALYDASGAALGKARLGKKAPGRGEKGADGEYVLIGDDPRSWLVSGYIAAGAEIADWVDPVIVEINVATVVRAAISRADGEVLEVYRTGTTEQGTPKFEIAGGVPDGKKVKADIAVRYAATDLANLRLVDVRTAKAGGTRLSDARLTTSTGLIVDYRLDEDETGKWLSVRVAEAGSDDDLAKRITKTTAGWQYKLETYKTGQLQKRLSDLVEDIGAP